ncbi:alpha/beta-hydrolase [Suhomyces tanzawaensis NRRL Y-17324]|uniref:Alpha/beta-hydrolase n=1 Tax=Suhomyces tanzawaensis NRRL Y-17324 TaxID=984487 RepID=A0A1E4SJH4_9ASCO|nr:alpha/beta-hydrolase [Suhomyces tanzawaensis NRRL Y-17324]ODV79640.1 alpha/beta-hydrolase [Suhomyces tanzawaensis NRRL Y-17324]
MVSVRGSLLMLRLTPELIYYILRYFVIGSPYRKLKNRFVATIKMVIYRWGISLPIPDGRFISFLKNKTLINSVIPLAHKQITSKYNNYGKQFDPKSIWIYEKPDRKPSDPVLIYLHGGGYYIQTAPSQVTGVMAIHQLLDPEKRKNLSILLLDYSLACHGFTLPTQLNELDSSYTELSKGCSNIILMGDSAGGHLALTYSQKLKLENIPNKPYPSKLVLISPWVKILPSESQFTPGNSFYDNDGRDIIQYYDMNHLKHVVGDNSLNSLLMSPSNKIPQVRSDWNSIPTFANPDSDIFVLLGEDEAFRDDILEWCDYALGVPLRSQHKYGHFGNFFDPKTHSYHREGGSEGASVRIYVEPWGVHDSCFFFEDSLFSEIKKKKRTLKDVDQEKYFGLYRVAKFLNDKL